MSKDLRIPAIFLSLIPILTYFMGWMYLHYFLNYFGIELNSVSVDFYAYFVYSLAVIGPVFDKLLKWASGNYSEVILISIVTILYLIFGRELFQHYMTRAPFKFRKVFLILMRRVAISLAIVFVFYTSYQLARAEARDFAQLLRFTNIRKVEIVFRSKIIEGQRNRTNDRYSIKGLSSYSPKLPATLIFATKNKYFVLLQPISNFEDPDYLRQGRVLVLHSSDIVAFRHIVDEDRRR